MLERHTDRQQVIYSSWTPTWTTHTRQSSKKDPKRQNKPRDHRQTWRKAETTEALLWQTEAPNHFQATYQHSRTNNPRMESSRYKGKHSKSSSILHRDNARTSKPETESPTDQGSSSTHKVWWGSTPARPTSSHERLKSTSQSLYDKEWTSCATATSLRVLVYRRVTVCDPWEKEGYNDMHIRPHLIWTCAVRACACARWGYRSHQCQ